MKRDFKIHIALLSLLIWALPARSDGQDITVERGTIEGAHYTITRPGDWNGKLLIFAHGLRPPDEPLRAGLNPERMLYSTLLGQGWMAADTSYRRNGIIIGDAIEDIRLLLGRITEKHGEPMQVFLMGNSMGGIIGTLIAERFPEEFDAVLAAGAALRPDVDGGALALTHDPKIPVLFLTNRSEFDGPEQYVHKASGATVPPALWRVERDGHVNVNDEERLAALRALEQWVAGDEIARFTDGTIATIADSTATISNGIGKGRINGASDNHGNIFTSFVPGDLQELGIGLGDTFAMTINGHTVEVLMGSNYGEVGRGEWIGIMRAEGFLMVARNFTNACETVDCSPGDTVTIVAAQ